MQLVKQKEQDSGDGWCMFLHYLVMLPSKSLNDYIIIGRMGITGPVAGFVKD